MSPSYVGGIGPFNADLFICAEAPGREENEAGIPLVGPTGKLTREMVETAGYKWGETYRTNVVKYQPPLNDITKLHLIGVDLQESINKLWEEEIKLINPKCILVMGDVALNAVCNVDGIMNYRGSILHCKDRFRKVVATIHPAALFSKPDKGGLPYVYRKLIQSDINKAVAQSKFGGFNLPIRNLSIARNSLDVLRFFRGYHSLKRAACDIESINCIPISIAFAFNRQHALSIPLLTKIGPYPLTDMTLREMADCWIMIQEAIERLELVGQNFKYDEYKLGLCGFRGFNCVSDTLLKTHTIFPELPDKRLQVQASLWTDEPYYKEDGKEAKIGKKFDVDKFFTYNARDSAVTKEIDEEEEQDLIDMQEKFKVPLVDFYYNYVMKKHSFYLKMENNGFRVDNDRKKELKKKYEQMRETVHEKLNIDIGYDVNVKSTPQMFRLLYEEMKFPKRFRTPTSEDIIVALLANHCKGKTGKLKETILINILEERRIRDQLSRQINFTPDYDGRCKTIYKISGTETARTSTSVLKKPVRPKPIGLAFHTISAHGRLGRDIKSMFIPDEGKVIIEADASQAEPRIVAALCEDWELLEAFDVVDIHRRTAGLLFGYTQKLDLSPHFINLVDALEKGGPERYTGKTVRNAGNYDVGKHTTMITFNTNAQKYDIKMSISEYAAGKYLELFHQASPKIKGIFHRDIKAALDNLGYLINPFGRPRVFNGRRDDELYKEGYAQIPQSTVADLVQGAALKADEEFNNDIDKTKVFFVKEGHDSLAIEAPIDNWEPYARVLKKHMELPIDFSPYCTLKRDYKLIIPCSIEISMTPEGKVTNYGEMYKVKVKQEVAV